jgi:hypothetical protein
LIVAPLGSEIPGGRLQDLARGVRRKSGLELEQKRRDPADMAAATEVPDETWYPPPVAGNTISTPGAASAMWRPRFPTFSSRSSASVAVTGRARYRAGDPSVERVDERPGCCRAERDGKRRQPIVDRIVDGAGAELRAKARPNSAARPDRSQRAAARKAKLRERVARVHREPQDGRPRKDVAMRRQWCAPRSCGSNRPSDRNPSRIPLLHWGQFVTPSRAEAGFP